MAKKAAYKRVLLKISGEALSSEGEFGFSSKICGDLAKSLKQVYDLGIELAIVVGGGNFFRGVQAKSLGLPQVTTDQIGMLATVMNGLLLQQAFTNLDLESRVMSSFQVSTFVEPFSQLKAQRHLKKGRILIFVGGTGNPFFTTDSAAALRAGELNADIILKATKVDGIYTDDPKVNPKAKKIVKISYQEVLAKGLNFMDAAAISICEKNKTPICVFNLFTKGSIIDAVLGKQIGSLVGVKS